LLGQGLPIFSLRFWALEIPAPNAMNTATVPTSSKRNALGMIGPPSQDNADTK
jgi:hypothetical protein